MAADLIIGSCALFVAGLVQGCTGFGLALVAAPLLMWVSPPVQVVPTIILLSTLNTFIVACDARRHIRIRLLAPLLVGGLIGLPLGIHALRIMPGEYIKILVGLLASAFAAASLAGWRRPVRHETWALAPVGILSGVFGGSTSMGGPPIALFLTNQETPKNVFRGTIVCYFLILNCAAAGLFVRSGLLTWDTTAGSAMLAPAMLAGTFVGLRLVRRISEPVFRRFSMALVAIMGLALLISNIPALFR